jgi:hypothetical protein
MMSSSKYWAGVAIWGTLFGSTDRSSTGFRVRTRSKLDMWEWELRVMGHSGRRSDRRPISPLPGRSWRCAPGELRWAPRLSADAQTSAAGCGRKRSGVSGSNDSVAIRYASGAASQHVEFATGRPSGRMAVVTPDESYIRLL